MCFEVIPITVVECEKVHGLLGIDVLKVDTARLINSMEAQENEIGMLKGYKASIRLKENYHPKYVESRKVPIHIPALVVAKLNKMIQQGELERVTQGGSN